MKLAINIRRLRTSDPDLAALAAALNQADSEVSIKNFSENSLQTFLADPQNFYLLAFIGDDLAGAIHGYCLLHPTGIKYLYIDEVDTLAGFRRRGVATRMMREAFNVARQYGASEAWLGTEDDNEPAKLLYESLGPSEIENGPIYTFKINQATT